MQCSIAIVTLDGQEYVVYLIQHLIQSYGHSYGVGPPFAAKTTSNVLGRFYTKCWSITAGICFHSARRALVKLGTDWAISWLSSLFPNVHTILKKTISIWTLLCAWDNCHAETGKDFPKTVNILHIVM
uniref:Uncharacterized protein n=1 Tax=Anguilla anguilla TaxID=7936 RepID=A0A0E9WCS2_ANGAN